MLCLGQKLAAIEKLFMWKSIGMRQHTIKENRGRRVREKTLHDFLSSVEQDKKNLGRMKISSSFRLVTQPELMLSMGTPSLPSYGNDDIACDDDSQDFQLKSYRSFKLPQYRTKVCPAESAAREAFIPEYLEKAHDRYR